MWVLRDKETGKILRKGAENQWELTRTCYKADGSHFKRAESLQLQSGTVIYRHEGFKQQMDYSIMKVDGENGHSGPLMLNRYLERPVACVLEEIVFPENKYLNSLLDARDKLCGECKRTGEECSGCRVQEICSEAIENYFPPPEK